MRFTIHYTREEVVPGTEVFTGNLVKCSTTIDAEDRNAALQQYSEEYAGTDARLRAVVEHATRRISDGLLPTERYRVQF